MSRFYTVRTVTVKEEKFLSIYNAERAVLDFEMSNIDHITPNRKIISTVELVNLKDKKVA